MGVIVDSCKRVIRHGGNKCVAGLMYIFVHQKSVVYIVVMLYARLSIECHVSKLVGCANKTRHPDDIINSEWFIGFEIC